jgi:hypothetical protein
LFNWLASLRQNDQRQLACRANLKTASHQRFYNHGCCSRKNRFPAGELMFR